MLKDRLTLIINTCDKYSDLWSGHVELLNRNWADRGIDTFLVTDKATDRRFDNVTVVSAGEGTEITERLRAVLPMVQTEYILFTLDDYYLTEAISSAAIERALDAMGTHKLDYLRLFIMTKKKLRNRKAVQLEKDIYLLDNYSADYIVSLYAGIWRKDFMERTVGEKLNAWQYEVALTAMARQFNVRCGASNRREFPILDVIRKGKLLPKAARYFKNDPVYQSDRPLMKARHEWLVQFCTSLREWLPAPLRDFTKAVMRRLGYSFFSDALHQGDGKKS